MKLFVFDVNFLFTYNNNLLSPKKVLYYDTDSVIYRSSLGNVHPTPKNAMGRMTDDLDGAFITEITSNGAKTYAYKTIKGRQSGVW